MINIINKLKSNKLPTLIYGAGISGQALFFLCKEQGIKIEGFCDNNIEKESKSLLGLEIIHTKNINKRYPAANWIVSSSDILDVKNHLIDYGFNENNIYAGGFLLKDFDHKKYHKLFQSYNTEDHDKGFFDFAINSSISCHQGYLDNSKIFMRSVDIVVTEKCTMKCVDCSNLMQFFEKPVNYELSEMVSAISKLCQISDEIFEFRIIGGEPFVHKEVHLLIEMLISEPKVKRIVIYTNGNIIPRDNQLPCLSNEKVLFNITDYSNCGDNSSDQLTQKLSRFKKITNKLEEICIQNSIDYRRHPPENWTDCGKIENFKRTDEENQKVFNDCCCKNLVTLSKNELHRCPFSAQITRLNVINESEDYLNLNNLKNDTHSKENMNKFLNSNKFLKACNYCTGRALHDPQITPAIQTKETLPYIKLVYEN